MRLLVLIALGCDPLGVADVDPPGVDRAVAPGAVPGDSDGGDSGKDSDSAHTGGTSATETGDSRETGTTETGDTDSGSAETGETGSTETGETGSTETGPTETGPTETGGEPDTSATETGDEPDTSATETGEEPDTGTSEPEDTADTGTSSTEPEDTADTGTSWPDTGDTATGVDTGDLGWSSTDTGGSWGTEDSAWTGIDTADTADTADSATTVGGTADTADTSDTAVPLDTGKLPDTGKPLDTGNNFPTAHTGVVLTDTDTSVYTPAACDSGDTGGGCSDVIRFVALGDAGTGDYRQISVANAIEAVCAVEGCDFALYLGDNLYPAGASDVTDALWTSNFEVPYSGLGFQFYAVLGNHDYGGYFDTGVAAVQVAYTAYSSKWYMPSRYYTEVIGDLTVIGLDSQALQLGNGADQEAWIPGALAGIGTTWTIAIGHHPYISNGPHGDAGEFDGRAGEGIAFKDFFDSYLCGSADVYLAGHDHALQWLQVPATCDTLFLVAGGGGSGRYPIVGTHPADFEDSNNGFLWVELDGNLFTGVFYDATGTELYRASFTK